MNTAIEILKQCDAAKVKLKIAGPNALDYVCPKDALTDDLKQKIIQSKALIITYLKRPKLVVANKRVNVRKRRNRNRAYRVEVDGKTLTFLNNTGVKDVRAHLHSSLELSALVQ